MLNCICIMCVRFFGGRAYNNIDACDDRALLVAGIRYVYRHGACSVRVSGFAPRNQSVFRGRCVRIVRHSRDERSVTEDRGVFAGVRRFGAVRIFTHTASLTYLFDSAKRESLPQTFDQAGDKKTVWTYCVFFAASPVLIILTATIPALSGLSVPMFAAGFLIGGLACGLVLTKSAKKTFAYFGKGTLGMLPAVQ